MTDQVNRLEAIFRDNGRQRQSWNRHVVMQHPRLYARLRPEGRMSAVAKIVFGPAAPVLECKLVDYSAGGACLQLEKYEPLPERFDILYGTTRKHCRLVWKRGLRVGVAF